MSSVGQFLNKNNQYLQDLKLNISYSDLDFPSKLDDGAFEITVGTSLSYLAYFKEWDKKPTIKDTL